MENSVSSFTDKETDEFNVARDNSTTSKKRTMASNTALARGKLKIAMSKDEDSNQCSQNLLQKKADFNLNFQHLGASATRLSIMLINKKGEDITDSAPPVENDDGNAAATELLRVPVGLHEDLFPPLGVRHMGQATALSQVRT